MSLSRRTHRSRARTRLRAWIVAVALVFFAFGSISPVCLVAPAMAHDAVLDGAATAPIAPHPVGDVTCCHELRDASVALGAFALPAWTRPGWSALEFAWAPSVLHPLGARVLAQSVSGGLPAAFAPIPAYLSTLRLRI